MEKWDLYDENYQPTGRTISRGAPLPDGTYHLVVHVVLRNAKGQMLIQQRQETKAMYPGMWDITLAGNALAGESSQEAASREIGEELGVKLDLTGIRPDVTVHFHSGFDDIYLIREGSEGAKKAFGERPFPSGMEDFTLQEEEVQAVRWASEEEVLDLLERGEFLPYYPGFLSYLFAMEENSGFTDPEKQDDTDHR